MSSGVKKIMTVLIVAVLCVMVGAFLLNILVPNAFAQGVNAVEDMIFRATSLEMDFNLDGNKGSTDKSYDDGEEGNVNGAGVEGFD